MRPDEETRRDEDARARERALDPERSFLVQAPAGSGKTGLLIQRFLRLLARVSRPEGIVAITFTRKAAAEMRSRIVAALVGARDATPVDSEHARLTRSLAQAALINDERHGWCLIDHSSRLVVRTIDALAKAVATQAPIASGLPINPRFTEEAGTLYREAVREALASAGGADERWRRLLDHQDNDADRLVEMLTTLVAVRDRWSALASAAPGGRLRESIDRTLAAEVAGELGEIAAFCRRLDPAALARHAGYAARRLPPDRAALADQLARIAAAGGWPAGALDSLDAWRALAEWTLTRKGEVRARLATADGFPSIGHGAGSAERRAANEAAAAWLAELAREDGYAETLGLARRLPDARVGDDTWARIEALVTVMPDLANALERVFRRRGELDFVQGTIAALRALGDPDAPSDLLVRLDQRIDHLLIDEFQDTSYAQLDLVRRLTAGWQPGDGRTLFAVGDPMQSIYRFRGAEVRAFVEAQASARIEGVPVDCLTLRRNFRSQRALVDEVNKAFAEVLGPTSDPWRGRVAYAEAVAVRPPLPGPAWTLDIAGDPRREAALVVARVREALADGDVAILGRRRADLLPTLAALREAAIEFSVVDVDTLGDRASVRDLAALAHAIDQPDDRLAWLAWLRSPACGLALADLDALVRAADATASGSIAGALANPPATLTDDGHLRVARAADVVTRAWATRGRARLADRVRDAWLASGGPAAVAEPLDLDAAQAFFARLSAQERAGTIDDWSALVDALDDKLAPAGIAHARVSVMTMHKAKGLEFDTVIVPGAARHRSRADATLMRWRARRHGLLIGTASGRGEARDPVSAYLEALERDEEGAELARLAYVAATRARRRFHLTATLRPDPDNPAWTRPPAGSLLGLLWPTLGKRLPPFDPADAIDDAAATRRSPPPWRRLPLDWKPPAVRAPLAGRGRDDRVEVRPEFDWARERARRQGVVVHRLLALVSIDGAPNWSRARIDEHSAWLAAELRSEGALPTEALAEAREAAACVVAVVEDQRGRWVYDPSHEGAASEWALSGLDAGDVVHVVLDRSFAADGVRWIVDVKTGAHEGADAEAFLDAEVARYREALERYARIVSALDPRPIRLALYHPRVPGGWREWAAAGGAEIR